MKKIWRIAAQAAVLAACGVMQCAAVELRVSRDALQRTLKQQLFNGHEGRYYLKGSATTPCFVYAEDPQVSFVADRIVVRVKAHARLGTSLRGTCLGVALAPTTEVSVAPDGEGETLGFRDARLEKVSDQRELNFVLSPFLSHTIPSNMKVNAADLLRKALTDSTVTSGYRVSLDRLKIHSIQLSGEDVVVDVDGGISVK
ncbi:MAG TPA: hypothetical protein VGJ21_02225 [Terracidiphilus sp.]|jgi:hypothetical protein